MKNTFRSTALALLSSGLLVAGVAACGTSADETEDSEDAEGGEAGSGAFTGSLSGELEYLTPGEYILDGQAFYVGEETEILGGLYTCTSDSAGDTGTVECPFDDFDSALADGTVVLAEVEIEEGITESITEFQA